MPFFIMDLKKDYQEILMEIRAKEQVVQLKQELQLARRQIYWLAVERDRMRTEESINEITRRALIVILASFEIVLFYFLNA